MFYLLFELSLNLSKLSNRINFHIFFKKLLKKVLIISKRIFYIKKISMTHRISRYKSSSRFLEKELLKMSPQTMNHLTLKFGELSSLSMLLHD